MNAALTIDQLLRAAQLLEQQGNAAPSALLSPLFKLGQDFEQRTVQPKLHSLHLDALHCANSTGSSQRSSPSAMSSAQSSTAPNSPPAPLLQASAGGAAPPPRPHSSSRQSRAAHNELEKNRRANLRSFLEELKAALPPDVEASRDTTLSLLTRACHFTRLMKRRQRELTDARDLALAEHQRLLERLRQLDEPTEQLEQQQQAEQLAEPAPAAEQLPPPAEQLPKPEPRVCPPSPCYLEFSPSAKPAEQQLLAAEQLLAAPQLSLLQQLAQLNSQLAALDRPRPSAAALLDGGLLPALPLLYPYPYLEQQQRQGGLC